MVTYSQYINKHRKTKIFKSTTPKFDGAPFRIGICVRVGTVKPKKPNSAQRKIAKVQLANEKYLIAYIPGFGHKLSKNSEVMVRGGRVPDVPGCRYHCIRFKKDLNTPEEVARTNRRSKYGIKQPNKEKRVPTRITNRVKKREELKSKITWDNIRFKKFEKWLKYHTRRLSTFFMDITKNA